jgi:hypothetical protein
MYWAGQQLPVIILWGQPVVPLLPPPPPAEQQARTVAVRGLVEQYGEGVGRKEGRRADQLQSRGCCGLGLHTHPWDRRGQRTAWLSSLRRGGSIDQLAQGLQRPHHPVLSLSPPPLPNLSWFLASMVWGRFVNLGIRGRPTDAICP